MLKQEIAPVLFSNFGHLDEKSQDYAKSIAYIPSTVPNVKSADYDETEMARMVYPEKLAEDEQGFMTKIIASLLRTYETTTEGLNLTNIRYWKTSCIESFVRGANPYLQLFIIRSGILKTLIREILTIDTHDD